jgi:hypothetical protein
MPTMSATFTVTTKGRIAPMRQARATIVGSTRSERNARGFSKRLSRLTYDQPPRKTSVVAASAAQAAATARSLTRWLPNMTLGIFIRSWSVVTEEWAIMDVLEVSKQLLH